MNGPPAAAAGCHILEPFGSIPTASPGPTPSYRIKVVNAVSNSDGLMRRRDAEHYVATGRAEWVAPDHLRLIAADPRNQQAAERAAVGYEAAAGHMIKNAKELRHVPITCPKLALTDCSGPRVRHVAAGRNGPVRVILQGGN